MVYQLGSLISLVLLLAAIALAGTAARRVLDLGFGPGIGQAPRASQALARIERWLLDLGLGFGVWVLLLFGLASFGLYAKFSFGLLAIASVLVGIASLILEKSTASVEPTTEPSANGAPRFGVSGSGLSGSGLSGSGLSGSGSAARRWAALLLSTGLCVAGCALVLQALRPDISWDANAYHLTLPRLFLEHGGFFRVPFNVYSNWPLGIEMLFGAAMGLRDYVLAKLLHLAFGALTAITVYRLAAPGARLLAATFFLFNPVVLYEIRIAYVDLAYAFFFLLASWCLSRALDLDLGSPDRRQWLWWCGLLAGVLCAVKLNGFFGPTALASVWILDSLRRRGQASFRMSLTEISILCLPSFLFGAPWLIKSWLVTGNPAYPLLFGVFGGPEWSATLAEQHATWQRSIGMGRGVVDFLMLPVRVVLNGDLGYEYFDGQIQKVWILLGPLALFGAARDRRARRYLWICGIYFVLWSVTSQQMRFLIPLLPLLSIVAAGEVCKLISWLRFTERARLASLAEVLVAAAATLLLIQAGWVYLEQTPRLARDLAAHGARLKGAVVQPVYRFIEQELPRNARLLLINTNHGFFVERDFIADSFFEASQIADAFSRNTTRSEVLATFRELGLTHALVENRPGPAYPDALVEVLQDPELSKPLYRSLDGKFVVLALAGPRESG